MIKNEDRRVADLEQQIKRQAKVIEELRQRVGSLEKENSRRRNDIQQLANKHEQRR